MRILFLCALAVNEKLPEYWNKQLSFKMQQSKKSDSGFLPMVRNLNLFI